MDRRQQQCDHAGFLRTEPAAGVAVDGAGNVYIANTLADTIRKWTAANNSVTTGVASAGLLQPNGVAVDGAGTCLYRQHREQFRPRNAPRFRGPDDATGKRGRGQRYVVGRSPTSVNLLPPFAPTSNQSAHPSTRQQRGRHGQLHQ